MMLVAIAGLWACWCIAFWLVWKDASARIGERRSVPTNTLDKNS